MSEYDEDVDPEELLRDFNRLKRKAEQQAISEENAKQIKILLDREVILPPHSSFQEVITTYAPEGWKQVFQESQKELERIGRLLEQKYHNDYYPETKDIFNAFHYTRLEDVKVVIFGQDPYHQQGRAQGLSFSVSMDDEIPHSLKIIFSELQRSLDYFKAPDHGCLIKWAKQGVLLLNSILTVTPNKPRSHERDEWFPFLKRVLNAIFARNRDTIFLLWGRDAQELKSEIRSSGIVLEACHPAARGDAKFVGCNHFIKVNKILKEKNLLPIDWQI